MKRCPTKHQGGREPRSTTKGAIAGRRRTKRVPDLYVKVAGRARWKSNYAMAHLRNKGGYLYLSWRDGDAIHTHYLGKAPKPCPTLEAAAARSSRRRLRAAGDLRRRGKNE